MKQRFLLPSVFASALLLVLPRATTAAKVVFATPGANASEQIQISWHAGAADTRLEYTKKSDPGFAHATVVPASAVSQTYDSTTFDSNSFYRSYTLLDRLDTGSEYLFRISGDSTTHAFKTAEGRGEFSFIFLSDTHAYPPIPSRMDKAEALVARAEQLQSGLSFILETGDITAHGANYSHWQEFADTSFAPAYVFAGTPGNHDFYNTSAVTIDDRFFNSVLRYPANGATGVVNTSYWFKYNNALFISISSEATSTTQVNAQKTWIRNVIENNPAQYIIAFSHRAFFNGSTGGAVRKSTTTYPNYGQLLEELGADLVLSGHSHVYVRTKQIRGGAVATTGRGTVYITANQIGDRGVDATTDLGTYGAAVYGLTTTSSASVITISDTAISGKMFEANGTIRDSYTIPARRTAPVDDFDKDVYANSFLVSVNPPDLTYGRLLFTDHGHDRVRTIAVVDSNSGATYASFAPSAGMTEALFGTLVPGDTYDLSIRVALKDGSSREVDAHLLNKLPSGSCGNLRIEEAGQAVLLRWENNLVVEEIERIIVSVNSEWTIDVPAAGTSADVTPGLKRGDNSIGFRVVDQYGDEIDSQSLECVFTPPETDAGTGLVDSGTGPTDSGTEQADGGHEGSDAAQPEQDAEPPRLEEWNVTGAGCSCSSTPVMFLMALTGSLGLARPKG
jgi:predicted MPP superfamily phosphohydrolase